MTIKKVFTLYQAKCYLYRKIYLKMKLGFTFVLSYVAAGIDSNEPSCTHTTGVSAHLSSSYHYVAMIAFWANQRGIISSESLLSWR